MKTWSHKHPNNLKDLLFHTEHARLRDRGIERSDIESEDESVMAAVPANMNIHDNHPPSYWRRRKRRSRTDTFTKRHFMSAFSNDRFLASESYSDTRLDDSKLNSTCLSGSAVVKSRDRTPTIPRRKKELKGTSDESSSMMEERSTSLSGSRETTDDEAVDGSYLSFSISSSGSCCPHVDGDKDRDRDIEKADSRYVQDSLQKSPHILSSQVTHAVGELPRVPVKLARTTHRRPKKSIAGGGLCISPMKADDEKKRNWSEKVSHLTHETSSRSSARNPKATANKFPCTPLYTDKMSTAYEYRSGFRQLTPTRGLMVTHPGQVTRDPACFANSTRKQFRIRIEKSHKLISEKSDGEDYIESNKEMWNNSFSPLDLNHSNAREMEMTISSTDKFPHASKRVFIRLGKSSNKLEHEVWHAPLDAPENIIGDARSRFPSKIRRTSSARRSRSSNQNGGNGNCEEDVAGKWKNSGLAHPRSINKLSINTTVNGQHHCYGQDKDIKPFNSVQQSNNNCYDGHKIVERRNERSNKHRRRQGEAVGSSDDLCVSDDSRDSGRKNEEVGVLAVISSSMNSIMDSLVDTEFFLAASTCLVQRTL